MEAAYSDNFTTIYQGNSLDVLKQLPDESVNCCVTSPPYWALRDYDCDGQLGLEENPDCLGWATGDKCGECHVCNIVRIFQEVYRVLRSDGTLWLNYGDTYISNPTTTGKSFRRDRSECVPRRGKTQTTKEAADFVGPNCSKVLPGKSMVGIPWRIALALQADGWILRQDIIWQKPTAMPESVRDRCSKSHEYIFLLAKSPKYYYDKAAIKEPCTGNAQGRGDGVNKKARFPTGWDGGTGGHDQKQGRYKNTGVGFGHGHDKKPKPRVKQNASFSAAVNEVVDSRNRRSVWTVMSERYPEAHFATFPTKLIEPCILAGCPKDGVVLDPFMGSGTTAWVAMDHFRKSIGVELNAKYIELIKKRMSQPALPLEV
ncbi:hypothetical protein BVY04_03910 [bacterium M21]|nr:hypothetical protein BVY04_03910 [bacterium M21]